MSEQLVNFFSTVATIKSLSRAGWQRCGVEPCESVAEHTFGVALLALLTPAANLNRERCVAMALVHDLAESIVGDLTPHDSVSPNEKHRRERAAMEQLAQTLGDRGIVELWEEFESATTEEARLVRDLDVIEMAFQARQYEQAGRLSADAAGQFVESARQRVKTDAGRRLLELASVRSDPPPAI